ncbi:MAG: site-2 protease family protein [Solirubrobacterales bacterium]|nr:site-2 protease family protein [Solirubrobacterales bacterium]
MFGTGPSVQLVRIFGIRIGASPSWFVVLFVFIFLLSDYFQDVLDGSSTEAYGVAVAAVLLFFVSLVLHELGHALVARRLGIAISGIDLWFFGGVAKMSRDTDSPATEFKVAAAGPAVTLLVVAICVGLSALISQGQALDVAMLDNDAETSPALALLGWLALINAAVFVFNMIPAFPLDGGRLARAAVWRITGDRNRATRAAGRVGAWFGYALVGFGVFLAVAYDDLLNGIYLGVLGWFLAQAARSAVVSTAFTERLDGITVTDIMDSEPVSMPAGTSLSRAQEEFFLRYRWDFFPVTDERGRFMGVVREGRVEAEIAAGRPALEVLEVVEAHDADGWRVRDDRPLESLLGDEELRARGALMAVDADGVLRGVVTVEQVRRALTAALPQRLG